MNHEIIVKKVIQSNVRDTYQAFADGKIWSQWFSDDTKVDLKPGGRFTNADGDTGVFLNIIPNQLLHFTWEGSFAGSQIELKFSTQLSGGTEVSLRHFKLATLADAQKMTTCWSWTLDNLCNFLETGKPLTMSEWKSQHHLSI